MHKNTYKTQNHREQHVFSTCQKHISITLNKPRRAPCPPCEGPSNVSCSFVSFLLLKVVLHTKPCKVGWCNLEGWSRPLLGGAINRETSGDVKVDQIHTKFVEQDVNLLPRPAVQISNVWSKWARLALPITVTTLQVTRWPVS